MSRMDRYALYSVLSLAERVLVFCGVVETLRKAKEAGLIQARAVRIHALMSGWLLMILLMALLTIVDVLVQASSVGGRLYVWNGAVFGTVSLTATCLMARRFRMYPDAGVRWVEPSPTEEDG